MRNFQFAQEIDFTRSKKRKRRFAPGRWTLIQRMTIVLLMVMLFVAVLVLGIVFPW